MLRIFKLDNLPFFLVLILVFACAHMPPLNLERPIYDFQVVFDVSQSMNVVDVDAGAPRGSRLELSRSAAYSLMLSLPCGSRIGWGAFTGRRTVTLLTPLEVCRHHDGLLASLEQIDGRMRWVEGSSIGKGLHQALRAVQTIGDQVRIVFISDGHEAPPLRHGQSGIPRIAGLEVNGWLVGVGGETPVPIPKTDSNGRVSGFWQAHEVVQRSAQSGVPSREELSSRRDDHLLKLAQYAGLNYLVLDSKEVLADAVRQGGFSKTRSAPVDIRWMPALAALLILGWRFSPFS